MKKQIVGRTLVVTLESDLIGNTYVFKGEILMAFAEELTSIKIIMSDVGNIDASGISMLLALGWKVHERQGEILLVNLQPNVETALKVPGLYERFKVIRE